MPERAHRSQARPRHRIITRMRINLATPFAEKDAAKALGARWDGALRTWYITDVADLTPFRRWIADAAADASRQPATPPRRTRPTAPSASAGTVTASVTLVVHCGCTVLPWEPCSHG